MSSLGRLQLLSALRKQREAMQAATNPLDKLQAIKEIRALRAKLGALDSEAQPSPDQPAQESIPVGIYPEPKALTQDPVNEHHKTLIAVSKGAHDSEGLTELFGRIQSAVLELQESQMLEGPVVDAANAAITHWGELDQQLNG